MSRATISAKNLLARKEPFVAVDATWFMPNAGRNGKEEYVQERLPGAVFYDMSKIKADSPYPHMMVTKAEFEKAVGELGIKPDDFVVIYDKQAVFSSPRVQFVFDTFKHPNAVILDNYAEYKRLGGPIESGEPKPREPTKYSQPGDAKPWVTFEQLKSDVESKKDQHLLDARPGPMFAAGHVPGAKSLPFPEVLVPGGESVFKSDADLVAKLNELDVLDGKPVVVMCGSGVTACVVKAAIDKFLETPSQVYDGSWGEWSVRASPELIEK